MHREIKLATQELHKELDHKIIMKRLMSSNVALDDYKWFLYGNSIAYKVLEDTVYNKANDFFSDKNLNENKRLHLLMNDLNHFNNEEFPTLDVALPISISKENVLGFLYVLEGSRLGAKYIAKHLVEKTDLKPEQLTFLNHNPSVIWNEVVEKLQSVDIRDTSKNIEGAITAFKLFISIFEKLETVTNVYAKD